ncbi:tetratricopeptide repeat protein [Streptomyces sp. NPDC050619]|uniref:tetratricopeptide repeat protein n=1 Tax=Streptomyces sp. NPDC050619 TaxID=3157214 RepID=UPI0034316D7C
MLPHLAPGKDDTDARPLLIFAVTGMGGIGKTALALEAAHRTHAQGWFPGGTLFVDLRGYDDNPVTADQAVLSLLDALGVRGPDLPPTAARQYDAYRKLLSERQDRALLILDNASAPSQFLPLLPGTDHHRVLITSRDRPDSLPVRLIDLETLAPDDSVALVTRALYDSDERDDRPQREPDALRELTYLCGQLPLALQIAAAMLRRRRHRGIASLVSEIRKAGDPTVVLDNGSPGTDLYGRSLVLRPVLETSYRRLAPDRARLLRLLAIAPGAETSTEAVTALAGLDEQAVLSLLEDLAATYLVSPVVGTDSPTAVTRWRVHDLVRAFGQRVVASDPGLREEADAARERVLAFCHRWAMAADERSVWLPGRPEPERFADRPQAWAWLRGERATLVAAVQWAHEERFATMAVRLAQRLVRFLEWWRHVDDGITVARTALEVTQRSGDRAGEAKAWNHLGMILRSADRAEEAIECCAHSRLLCQEIEDRKGEADAWDELAISLSHAGRSQEAIEIYTRARAYYRSTGNRQAEGWTWNHLGMTLQDVGRIPEAIEAHVRARDLFQAVGDRHREGLAWSCLGTALNLAGRHEEALDPYGHALAIHREFEDWYRVGGVLHNLALTHEVEGRPAEAHALWLQAAEAFTRANSPEDACLAQSAADALT